MPRFGEDRLDGGNTPTLLVAPSTAAAAVKRWVENRGGFVCDGVADEVEIHAALATGNPVEIIAGTFYTSKRLTVDGDGLILKGPGRLLTTIDCSAFMDGGADDDVGLLIGGGAGAYSQHNIVGGFTVAAGNGSAYPCIYHLGGRYSRLFDIRTSKGLYGLAIRRVGRCSYDRVRVANWETGGAGLLLVAGTDGSTPDPLVEPTFYEFESEPGARGGIVNIASVIGAAGYAFLGTENTLTAEDEVDELWFINPNINAGYVTASCVGMSIENGLRCSGFLGGFFDQCVTACIDMTPAASTTRVRLHLIGTNIYNSSGHTCVDVVLMDTSYQVIRMTDCRIQRATDLVHVSANNPIIILDGCELNTVANVLNSAAGNPRLYIGPGMELTSVTNKVVHTSAAKVHSWDETWNAEEGVIEGWLVVGDGKATNKTLGYLPSNAIPYDVGVWLQTAFDGTSPKMDVGYASDPDAFAVDFALDGTPGGYSIARGTITAGADTDKQIGTARTIIARFDVTGTPTVGQVHVTIRYVVATAVPS